MTILAGAGCEGAHDEVVAIAERLKAPVVHAMRGKEFVEYDNPFDVGMTGLLGFVSGYRAMEHCDACWSSAATSPTARSTPTAPGSCRSTSAVSRSGGGCRSTFRSSAP